MSDYKFLTLLVLIFAPKISLISVPGYWQGIRIEDLLLLVFFLQFLTNKERIFWKKDHQFKFIILFFVYYFFSNCIGYISGITIVPMSVVRLAEYLILIFFINSISLNGNLLKKIAAIYLLLNLFVAFIQELGFIGSFTSLGYLEADNYMNARAMGISGGSWELGILSALSFFIYLRFEKNIQYIMIFYLITVVLLMLSGGRANFAAFLISSIFLFKDLLPRTKLFHLGLIFSTIFIFIYINNIGVFSNTGESPIMIGDAIFYRMSTFNFLDIFSMLRDFVFENKIPDRTEIMNEKVHLLSFVYRLERWSMFYNEYNTNILTQLFGTGMSSIYVESLIVRIWFTTGVVGVLLVLLLLGQVKVYQLVFFIISGFTLDIFVSFKIFLMTLLLNKKTK